MESDFSVYSLKHTGLDAGFCTKTICTSTQTNSGSTTLGTNLTSWSSGFSSRNSLWGYYEQSTVEQKQGIMCPVMVLYSMNIRCYQSWTVWQISWICLLIPNIRKKNISDNQKYISNVKFLDFKYNWSVWIFRTDSKAQKGMNDAPLVFFLLASTGTPGHLMLSHHLPVQQGPLSSLQTALEDKGFYRERLTSQIIGFIGYMVFIAVMTPLKTTNEECDWVQ